MSKQREDLLQFDGYAIDVEQRVLLSGGTPVALPPKVFDTLLALAEQPGRVLEKDYLLKTIWPDTFVEEGSLTRNVSTLRRVLGKSVDDQDYIETVPRRGYRFKGDVRRVSAVPATPRVERLPDEPLPEDDPSPARVVAAIVPTSRRAGVAWGVGLLLVVVSALAAWRLSATARPGSIDSLAVLPFLNLTGDPDGEYFSDGLTEELINSLANIPGLHVVSRTTMFQFKNRADDVRELGKRLSVDAIMEGSVRRDGDRTRVTVQLNSVRNGYHYWSKTWDSTGKDVFAIQQGIAGQVALSLRPSASGVIIAGQPLTTDLEAYNLYLQGQYHRRRMSVSSLKAAEGFFRKALERDPAFAEAYVGLGMLLGGAATDGRLQPSDGFPRARQASAKALELNPLLASAYSTRGWVAMHYDRDWSAAERDLRRAVDLSPADPETHHAYSHYLLAKGRFEESLAESQRAVDLDPLNAATRGHLVLHFGFAREFGKAIDAAKAALDIDPGSPATLMYGLIAYESTGRFQDAIDSLGRLGDPEAFRAALRTALAAEGAPGYWRVVRDHELPKFERGEANRLATAYAQLGQRSEAIDLLERAFRERNGWLVYLNVSPYYDGLRDDPRFKDLVARVGLSAR